MRRAKKVVIISLITVMVLMLSGCCIKHEWIEASCDTPKTCAKCGKTKGEALGHDWVEASCESPKTCSLCGETEGDALGHKWSEATCEKPKTCSVCGKTEGEALGHKWLETTPNYQQPKTCEICGATEGEPLEADWAGYEFAELDKEYDWEFKWGLNNTHENWDGKVWFTNYKIFDSDDTHEAVDGYEYRSVEIWQATKESNNHSGRVWDDYYLSDDKNYFSYYGEKYDYEPYEVVILENEDLAANSKYDYSKWGWEGLTNTYGERIIQKVPKGFDGFLILWLDMDEYTQKSKEWSDENSWRENAESMENCLVFRFN